MTTLRDFWLEHLVTVPAFRALRRSLILLGRKIIASWRANVVLTQPLLRRYYNEPLADDGASRFFVCERK